jgi:hypothetical protein
MSYFVDAFVILGMWFFVMTHSAKFSVELRFLSRHGENLNFNTSLIVRLPSKYIMMAVKYVLVSEWI